MARCPHEANEAAETDGKHKEEACKESEEAAEHPTNKEAVTDVTYYSLPLPDLHIKCSGMRYEHSEHEEHGEYLGVTCYVFL